jgi:holo-[acyl-carrier protein] synthase
MKIIGIGNDIVEVERIEKAINKSKAFCERVYTQSEISYAEKKKNKYETYAGRFCAKEAVSKAFGTGIRDFSMKDIEILNDNLGKPYVKLWGSIREKYENYTVMVTISHCKKYATASAIIIKN